MLEGRKSAPSQKEVKMARKKNGRQQTADNRIFVVGDPAFQAALEKCGLKTVSMWEYRQAEKLAEAAMQNVMAGLRTVAVFTPSTAKYVPGFFWAARAGCPAIEYLGCVDPKPRRGAAEKLTTENLRGFLKGFQGWYYLEPGVAPRDPVQAAERLESRKLLKSFKELEGLKDGGGKDQPF